MKHLVKILFVLFSTIFILVLLAPNPGFPEPPGDSLQSREPGDTESSFRRAYFTNCSREEVIGHYFASFQKKTFLGINIPSIRLNYPPEDAQTLIRDQTRSTFLEEIVHPFRESLFINGFEPTNEKDLIFIEGKVWRQKITIRYVTSGLIERLLLGFLTIALIKIILKEFENILPIYSKK